MEFRDFGVSDATLRGLASMGFDEATPIQAQAIPLLMAGRDLIAQALTGTGKTAAFGVPIVEAIDPADARPQAIVLTPTRELAIQVTDQLVKIGQHRRISVLSIYGGAPIWRQLEALRRGVHIVVATPGRLLDHMRRGSIDLRGIRMLILDEADQMLEMGFIEDVQYVLEHLPTERVTGLFSATMPKPIVDLAQQHLREPEHLQLAQPRALTVPDTDQLFYLVPFPRKLDALCRVLDIRRPERAVVFCSTKRTVDDVVETLAARGYQAAALHGDIGQTMRERVLRSFRSGNFEVLVATDVAARGLDVPEVSHVINFDIPPDPEYYVHRIGRTGRYGRQGVAITFVNPRELRILKIIERVTGANIRREEVPTAAEAEQREAELLGSRLSETLGNGGGGRYRPVVERLLLENHDPIDLAAAALEMLATSGASIRRASRPAAAVRAADVAGESPARPIVQATVVRPHPDRMGLDNARRPVHAGPDSAHRPERNGGHDDRLQDRGVPDRTPRPVRDDIDDTRRPDRTRQDSVRRVNRDGSDDTFRPDRRGSDGAQRPSRNGTSPSHPALDGLDEARRLAREGLDGEQRHREDEGVPTSKDGRSARRVPSDQSPDERRPGESKKAGPGKATLSGKKWQSGANKGKPGVNPGPSAGGKGKAGAGKGRDWSDDRREGQGADRKPRRLVTGFKSWERRPKSGGPPRPPGRQRPR